MMKWKRVLAVFAVLAFVALPAWGDWDPSQPGKWVQMPDPTGWDVDVVRGFVADDWQCTRTGPVSDIHFWMSKQGDYGIPDLVWLLIHPDIPADQNPLGYSMPNKDVILWDRIFVPGEYTVSPPLSGDEGWYTPWNDPPVVTQHDHTQYYQVNVQDIQDPFIQEEGTVYWLELHMTPADATPLARFGWKTSLDHWNDDAVYLEDNGPDYVYMELWDPIADPTFSLDMAFVITTVPEPATVVLLMLGCTGVLAISRRMNR